MMKVETMFSITKNGKYRCEAMIRYNNGFAQGSSIDSNKEVALERAMKKLERVIKRH